MHDTSGSATSRAGETGAIRRRTPASRTADHDARDDDADLARLLITSWMLATGRALRADVPPHLLSQDELITFWADDQLAAAGEAPAAPAPGSEAL